MLHFNACVLIQCCFSSHLTRYTVQIQHALVFLYGYTHTHTHMEEGPFRNLAIHPGFNLRFVSYFENVRFLIRRFIHVHTCEGRSLSCSLIWICSFENGIHKQQLAIPMNSWGRPNYLLSMSTDNMRTLLVLAVTCTVSVTAIVTRSIFKRFVFAEIFHETANLLFQNFSR